MIIWLWITETDLDTETRTLILRPEVSKIVNQSLQILTIIDPSVLFQALIEWVSLTHIRNTLHEITCARNVPFSDHLNVRVFLLISSSQEYEYPKTWSENCVSTL